MSFRNPTFGKNNGKLLILAIATAALLYGCTQNSVSADKGGELADAN